MLIPLSGLDSLSKIEKLQICTEIPVYPSPSLAYAHVLDQLSPTCDQVCGPLVVRAVRRVGCLRQPWNKALLDPKGLVLV